MAVGERLAGFLLPVETSKQVNIEGVEARHAVAQRGAHHALTFSEMIVKILLHRLLDQIEQFLIRRRGLTPTGADRFEGLEVHDLAHPQKDAALVLEVLPLVHHH